MVMMNWQLISKNLQLANKSEVPRLLQRSCGYSSTSSSDQRKINAALGELEARQQYEDDTGGSRRGGLFGARKGTTADAMELVITRLTDELLDDEQVMSSKDRHAGLEELTRHLNALSSTVMTDLDADFRRVQLLISSSEVLLNAAIHTRGVADAGSEAVEEEEDK